MCIALTPPGQLFSVFRVFPGPNRFAKSRTLLPIFMEVFGGYVLHKNQLEISQIKYRSKNSLSFSISLLKCILVNFLGISVVEWKARIKKTSKRVLKGATNTIFRERKGRQREEGKRRATIGIKGKLCSSQLMSSSKWSGKHLRRCAVSLYTQSFPFVRTLHNSI